MRANSLKHYRGSKFYEKLREVAKEVTYTDLWSLVFPESKELIKILIFNPRPNRNKELYQKDLFQNLREEQGWLPEMLERTGRI